MTFIKHPIDVGEPIPELNNSPLILDIKDERELIESEIPEERICYFNGESYTHGSTIKSNGIILQCDRGVWVQTEMKNEF
ncbi:MAG: DUF1496 domain-containing protein [Pseudohongiella sp.]|nr:DUF1496 domain-containing protein [Pseudohongiella sp.]